MTQVRCGSVCWWPIVLSLLATAAADAQSVSGSISGSVVDQSGQVIPGAAVTLVDEQTGASRGVGSNESGGFVLSAVQPGRYTVRVEMSGFRTYERTQIVLPANEQLALGRIQLDIGGIAETVTTVAQGSYVQTASSERSALLTATQLEMVAVRGRDVMSLLRVLPGVSYSAEIEAPGGSFGTTTPNISGNRNTWNTVTVDGLVGNDLGSPQIFSGTINFDAIGEVKVQLNNYQAEHGRNGGSMVSLVTKSGTREYRGSAYAYKRHESLNANDFFNNRSGLPKPLYRYTTLGATLGGPAPVQKDKLFFFYSFENWDTRTPQPLRRVSVPTEAERRGDFSQTRDLNGNVIVIRNPLTGQPFPNNQIPASMINANGEALLRVFPAPNAPDRAITLGNYNYDFQESLDVPRRQHLVRLDYRPTAQDAIYGRFSNWYADNQGFAVPAGAANWGLLGQHYTFKDGSFLANYTRVVNASLVNELAVGVRHSTEAGSALSEEGLQRVTRSRIGYTLGQFNPSINPLGLIPLAQFGTFVPNAANITFEGRFPLTGADDLLTVNDTASLARGNHTFKAGIYFEHVRNREGNTASAFPGQFDFSRDTTNPFESGHPYANALLGTFRSYTEQTSRPGGDGSANLIEWFAQDTWRARPKLTLDYGARFAWYSHYRQRGGEAAAFVLERFDRARAPLLFQPVIVGGQRLARNPITGAIAPAVLIGGLVPGSGDLTNGLIVNTDDSYPAGFKEPAPILVEPRAGFSYDIAGNGKTAVRGSFGMFYNTRVSGNVNWQASRNPPIQFNPQIFYGTMDTLLQSTGVMFPSDVQGFERDTHTPVLYSYTAGVQRDIGWNTVVDLAYVGSQARHLLQTRNLNVVPAGSRFLPQNQDPTRPGNPLPDNFFRPFPGYGDVNFFENSGKSDYNALQVQVTRRFAEGLQFGVAYTLSRSRDFTSTADTGTGANMRIPTYADPETFTYGLSAFDQTHVAVINYTWELPKASSRWNNIVVRALLDNWQLSGITAFASGTPVGIDYTLSDNVDLSGGGDALRSCWVAPNCTGAAGGSTPAIVVTGDPTLSRGDRSLDRWFDTNVFARPARGQTGNGTKDLIRLPGLHNWDVTLFKRVPFGGGRRYLQFRWEMYNVFNDTQFAGVDTTARFDAAGRQVNARFGQIIVSRSPRIMQGSLRFAF